MNRNPPALLHNRVDSGRQCRHVVPMPVADGNALDLAHPDSEIGAFVPFAAPPRCDLGLGATDTASSGSALTSLRIAAPRGQHSGRNLLRAPVPYAARAPSRCQVA